MNVNLEWDCFLYKTRYCLENRNMQNTVQRTRWRNWTRTIIIMEMYGILFYSNGNQLQ